MTLVGSRVVGPVFAVEVLRMCSEMSAWFKYACLCGVCAAVSLTVGCRGRTESKSSMTLIERLARADAEQARAIKKELVRRGDEVVPEIQRAFAASGNDVIFQGALVDVIYLMKPTAITIAALQDMQQRVQDTYLKNKIGATLREHKDKGKAARQ